MLVSGKLFLAITLSVFDFGLLLLWLLANVVKYYINSGVFKINYFAMEAV